MDIFMFSGAIPDTDLFANPSKSESASRCQSIGKLLFSAQIQIRICSQIGVNLVGNRGRRFISQIHGSGKAFPDVLWYANRSISGWMPAQWIHDGIGCLDSVQICSDLRTGNRFVTIWHTDARSNLPPDADFSRKVDLDVVRICF